MRATRAESVRRELAGLARTGNGTEQFIEATCATLGRAVPFEFACMASTDPATGLITSTYKSSPEADMKDGEFARLEYATEDINQFCDISLRATPVGVLERDTAGRPDRCVRYRDFLVPHFAHGHELRVAFRSRHGVWGVLGVYRPVGRAGFTEEEAAFMASVPSTVAEGFSAAATRRTVRAASPDGPAVITLGADDQLAGVTPAVAQYVEALGGGGAGELPMSVLSVAAAVRARRRGLPAPEPRVTLRSRAGGWLVLAGAPLSGVQEGDADVVVTIDQARSPDIVPILIAAFGLTDRERDVVTLVLAGQSTTEIAKRLHISAYTVQDHLRSIFDKAGVRSRRQLVASMFFEHYAPRLGQPLDHRGWFAADPQAAQRMPRRSTGP